MVLHLVNKSPHQSSALRDCLRVITDDDALLLLEDGTYGAVDGSSYADSLTALEERSIGVFVLQPDAISRGLENRLVQSVEHVDFPGFVQLTERYASCLSWF